jgi:hypothetical protein
MDGAGFEERGRAEGECPESKSHGISFASKATQRKWSSELAAICREKP